jgi:DNA-binding MarR family transcriptional regulator
MDSIALVSRILFVINQFFLFEKKNEFHFENLTLYPSELHLLLAIHDKDVRNITRIAEDFGLTKSAISQTVSRLVKKGILIKQKDPYAKNALSFIFTPFGERAAAQFIQKKNDVVSQLLRFTSELTDSENQVINRLLTEMEALMDD